MSDSVVEQLCLYILPWWLSHRTKRQKSPASNTLCERGLYTWEILMLCLWCDYTVQLASSPLPPPSLCFLCMRRNSESRNSSKNLLLALWVTGRSNCCYFPGDYVLQSSAATVHPPAFRSKVRLPSVNERSLYLTSLKKTQGRTGAAGEIYLVCAEWHVRKRASPDYRAGGETVPLSARFQLDAPLQPEGSHTGVQRANPLNKHERTGLAPLLM